ncbi:MAG: flavodoxin domain-containing protein [Acholeplasmatales bacterium]
MSKKAIIYTSYHHKNTFNLIKGAVNESDYHWYNLLEDNVEINLSNYDVVIFGSGIYAFRMHEKMLVFIKEHKKELLNKRIGVVITSGMKKDKSFKKKVIKLFSEISIDVKVFWAQGFNTFGFFKLFGGTGKNRPTKEDMTRLKEFIKENNL